LTEGFNRSRSQNEAKAAQEAQLQKAGYEAWIKSGDPELVALGLAGLNEGIKTNFFGQLQKSDTYKTGKGLLDRLQKSTAAGMDPSQELMKIVQEQSAGGEEGGPPLADILGTASSGSGGGASEAGGDSSAAPSAQSAAGQGGALPPPTSAAQAPPLISQQGSQPGGWAAAAGASPTPGGVGPQAAEADPSLAGVTSDLPGGGFDQAAATAALPQPGSPAAGAIERAQPGYQPPALSEDEAWSKTFRILNQDAHRLDPKAQAVRSMMTTLHASGMPLKEAWTTVLNEVAPNTLRSNTQLGVAGTRAATAITIAQARADALAAQKKGARPQLAVIQDPTTGQPVEGRYDLATDSFIPVKGGLKPIQNKLMMSKDAEGNENPVAMPTTFSKPSGGAPAAAGSAQAPAAPGATSTTPTAPFRSADVGKKEDTLKKSHDARMKDFESAGKDLAKISNLSDDTGADQATALATAIRGSAGRFTPMEQKFFASGQGAYGPVSVMLNRLAGGTEVVTPKLIQDLKATAAKQTEALAPQWAKEIVQTAKTASDRKLNVAHVVQVPVALKQLLKQRAQAGTLSESETQLLKMLASGMVE